MVEAVGDSMRKMPQFGARWCKAGAWPGVRHFARQEKIFFSVGIGRNWSDWVEIGRMALRLPQGDIFF
jgi:hypothetical protein